MLTFLNEKFTEWDGFDRWQRRGFIASVICFAIPALWATWAYWAEILTNMPKDVSVLTTVLLLATAAVVYFVLLGVLGWVWAYASTVIGVLASTVLYPFIWFYRKICP